MKLFILFVCERKVGEGGKEGEGEGEGEREGCYKKGIMNFQGDLS